MNIENHQAAGDLLKEAHQYQMGGEYEMAVGLYKRSLKLHSTAEAYIFLGWVHHYQGRVDDAIEEASLRMCRDTTRAQGALQEVRRRTQ